MDLFDLAANLARHHAPIVRDSDPITSHEAADKMIKSGELTKQENEVLKAAKEYLKICSYRTDFTAKDLRIVYMDYYKAERRLSGLRNKGKIDRLNTESGWYEENKGQKLMKRRGCCVWRLK